MIPSESWRSWRLRLTWTPASQTGRGSGDQDMGAIDRCTTIPGTQTASAEESAAAAAVLDAYYVSSARDYTARRVNQPRWLR